MNKVKFIPFIVMSLLIAIFQISGVFAEWRYSQGPSKDSVLNTNFGMSNWDVYNYDEIVIVGVTKVSSTVTNQSSKYSFPTNVSSTISGSSGQKIVYKIDAYNYSETKSFVYTGFSGSSNKISISASLDENGFNTLNNNVSNNYHQGTAIAPRTKFTFYVSYSLTGNVNSNEFLINYVFKPIAYTVTYLNNNQEYAIEHITNNAVSYSVRKDYPQNSTLKFAGWVNANAVVVSSIPAGNINNYTLSASWENVYLIIFADAKGNILYQEQFTSSSTALSQQGQATVNQILAQLNAEAEGQHMSVSWSDYTIKGAKADITVKAIYAYNGILNLVPVYEQPDDGIVDYYRVEAVDSLPETVIVPGAVGGVPVRMVKRITNIDGEEDWNNFETNVKTIIIEEGVESLGDKSDKKHNGNALAWTPNLTTVKLPSTITYLGKNTFSRNIALGGFGSGDDKKVLTIEFNGTKAQWKAILANSDSAWDGGLKDGSVVKCTDGYFELDKGLFSSSWKEKSY